MWPCYSAICWPVFIDTAFNAISSIVGNALPLRSALLKIPAHAVGLKKNLCGSTPVCKTRDNEDSTATLRDSEVLSVQHSVSEPIPEFDQRPEEGTKVRSFGFTRTEQAWDVLKDEPSGLELISDSNKHETEVAPRVVESLAESGDGEGLARSPSDQKVDCSGFKGPLFIFGE
jgi:hypothetical protein